MGGWWSGPPASTSATERPASTRRRAITQPADPAPTMMWSNSVLAPPAAMPVPSLPLSSCPCSHHANSAADVIDAATQIPGIDLSAPLGAGGPTNGRTVLGGGAERAAAGQPGQRRALDQLIEVLVEAEAVDGPHRVQVGVRLAELPQVGLAAEAVAVQTRGQALARGHGSQHDRGHPGQAGQRLVPVLPGAEIDLGQAGQADLLVHVDQHADLDPVAGEERHVGEQLPTGRELARQRLHEARELRVEEVEERLGHQLGDPAAAVGDGLLALLERTPVGGLDELDAGVLEYRAEGPVDEVLLEVGGVCVGEHDDVASCGGQGAPHRAALALRGAVAGWELVLREALAPMAA